MALPDLIVLGDSKNERGIQLEQLTTQLLSAVGYRVVAIRGRGAGGDEIDVSAERTFDEMGQLSTHKALCECKAFRKPADVGHWEKFLGKILLAESTSSSAVTGFFIALSGVTGTVLGQYSELREHGKNVVLITGDDLSARLANVFACCPLNKIAPTLLQYTTREPVQAVFAYHDHRVFSLVVFDDGNYTILDGACGPIPRTLAVALVPMVASQVKRGAYIDLLEEAEYRRVATEARGLVLSRLMMAGGESTLDVLLDPHVEYDEFVLKVALSKLQEEGLVVDAANGRVAIVEGGSDENRSSLIAEIYRSILSGRIVEVSVLGSLFYDEHINEQLIAEISSIQESIPFDDELVQELLRLVRFSPSALATALQPQPMIVVHRRSITGEIDGRTNNQDKEMLRVMLYNALKRDFSEGPMFHYFHSVRKLIEVETVENILGKSDSGIVFDATIRKRVQIGKGDESLGNKLWSMYLFNDVPEPWEPQARDWQDQVSK